MSKVLICHPFFVRGWCMVDWCAVNQKNRTTSTWKCFCFEFLINHTFPQGFAEFYFSCWRAKAGSKLNKMPVHCKVTITVHKQIQLLTHSQSGHHASCACFWTMEGSHRTRGEFTQMWGKQANSTLKGPRPVNRTRDLCCDVTVDEVHH